MAYIQSSQSRTEALLIPLLISIIIAISFFCLFWFIWDSLLIAFGARTIIPNTTDNWFRFILGISILVIFGFLNAVRNAKAINL